MPCVVWAGESKTGLSFEIGQPQKKNTNVMFNHNRELRDLLESPKNKISAIHDIHSEDMAEKDAAILEYSRKL